MAGYTESMQTSCTHRHMTWLTALVVLVSACLPSLAIVWGPQAYSTQWMAVCTAQGFKWVSLTDEGDVLASTDQAPSERSDSRPHTANDAASHCPWCLAQSTALPHVPAVLTVATVPGAPPPLPPIYLHGPRHQHAWSPLQSRAPPLPV